MLEDFRLKVFMAVARKRSFTAAARSLGITQPAVSQNIAELEKELGTELFLRGRGEVALTPSGSLFMEYADRILYLYSSAETLFSTGAGLPPGRPVRIRAEGFCAESVLPRLISRTLAAIPGVSFETVREDSEETDLRLWCSRTREEMSLEDSGALCGTISASVLTGVKEYSAIEDLRKLPGRTVLAVWEPYCSLLPFGLSSRVACKFASPSSVTGLVRENPEVVGIVPMDALLRGGLFMMPVSLPSLTFDLMAAPSDSFRGTSLCDSLMSMLGEMFES